METENTNEYNVGYAVGRQEAIYHLIHNELISYEYLTKLVIEELEKYDEKN